MAPEQPLVPREDVCPVLWEEEGPRLAHPGLPPLATAEALNGKETLL